MDASSNKFSFFKAWMRLQEQISDIQNVVVLNADASIEPWLGSVSHSIPTILLAVDLHLRIKTGPNKHLDLQPREAVCIRAGALHEHLESRHLGMYYGQGFMETYCDFRLVDQETVYRGAVDRDPLWDMFHDVMNEKGDEQRKALFIDYMNAIDLDTLTNARVQHPAALKMHEFIRLNAHRDITIQDIIASSGLADAQAFSVYKQSFNLTPLHHLLKRRVSMAQAYLRSGLGRDEVIKKSGFDSGRQMNRAFHRFVGMSPRDWLRKIRDEGAS